MLNKSQGDETDLRITVVRYNENNAKYQVVWSESRGDYPPLADNMMKDYQDRLPMMAHNDSVVETWDDYDPVFKVALDPFEIVTYSFTRPRHAPQLLYAGENNGWINDDQSAPDGSECTNNAENWDACTNNVEPGKGKGKNAP
ncbi:hypothetical protein [Aestuariicoccus sp. MJ-SS9]|uniref:hypothetical protein n=1 Tax=Aestuariicoccus sp. MJ-SS9 TaxID=3079855 RepID=UPI00290924A7|nr:hypothetical protein [Aestuariicoccus sp. MJ-SS9]MDU8911228.1 hypothetical protein [Aestuariicoccus sp. MJ-SS9]